MFQNWKYWPIVGPIVALLSSRKFLLALGAVLAADFGLHLSDDLIALIVAVGVAIVGGGIAIEDAAQKRASGGVATLEVDTGELEDTINRMLPGDSFSD